MTTVPIKWNEFDLNKWQASIESWIKNGFLIAYFTDRVCVGRWQNGKPVLPEQTDGAGVKLSDWDNLLELHIFNKYKEVRLVLSQEPTRAWIGRYRQDNQKSQSESEDWYDEKMLIIGNGPKNEPGEGEEKWGVRHEAGRSVVLPKEALGKCLLVRNYLCSEPVDIADNLPSLTALAINDYRFVDFCNINIHIEITEQ